MSSQSGNYLAVIKVVGVGGGGTNAVTRMVEAGIRGCDFIAINTDAQVLMENDADIKLAIGRERTHGLGAGADPRVGREAAEESRDEIKETLLQIAVYAGIPAGVEAFRIARKVLAEEAERKGRP